METSASALLTTEFVSRHTLKVSNIQKSSFRNFCWLANKIAEKSQKSKSCSYFLLRCQEQRHRISHHEAIS